MKIIKPSFQVCERDEQRGGLKIIEQAGRLCYKSEDKSTDDSAEVFVKGLVRRKHLSVLEHGDMIFEIGDHHIYENVGAALQAIKEAGLCCPDDIRIIGCDDIAACRYSSPKLTTVKQDKEKFGKLSAYMLDDLINNRSQLKPVFIDSELIIRESCETLFQISRLKENPLTDKLLGSSEINNTLDRRSFHIKLG